MRIVRGLEAALDLARRREAGALDPHAETAARQVVDHVRRDGDAALRDLTERFDGVRLDAIQVPQARIDAAADELEPELRDAIDTAAARIRAYYHRQPTGGFLHADEDGVTGQIVRPIASVGCYVPGGTAPLFSSLLMSAVPARVAGVSRLVVATPPRPDGSVAAEIRYAAKVVGADAVVRVGGAQAIAALAYGTDAVPRVDKIVGPGNAYVVAAKRLVYGSVGIESLPGPTETLVLADEDADPRHAAADLLAQAEHLGAQPMLVTWSDAVLDAILTAIDDGLSDLPTADAARESLAERGFAIRVADPQQALEVANALAPEHLCLLVDDPWAYLGGIRNAGGVFLGAHSMEALGDYVAGPSHVMPTSTTARFASFLNLRDFQKVIPVLAASPDLVARVGPAGVRMARAEGLEAHARAIAARLNHGD
ncbi:MAG: histidinol dehydrogenase [Trueperaceae bacterium]|nr:histidinol dehydrogenase [Trueperaceae bacterium]